MGGFIIMILVIGYFIGSLLIGIDQYRSFGELTNNYLIMQWIMLVLSIFINFRFQRANSLIGETITILSGGIALMIVLQAVLFFTIGDAISSEMSTEKIILLVIIGLLLLFFTFQHFTRGGR